MRTHAYGSENLQQGDLMLPGRGPAPVVALLHGGFWYPGYGRDLMEPVARDVTGRGYATWNLDYRPSRRTSGWPYLFEDVAAGVDYLAVLGEAHPGLLDLDHVVVGHSAGGQLGLWVGTRPNLPPGSPGAGPKLAPGRWWRRRRSPIWWRRRVPRSAVAPCSDSSAASPTRCPTGTRWSRRWPCCPR